MQPRDVWAWETIDPRDGHTKATIPRGTQSQVQQFNCLIFKVTVAKLRHFNMVVIFNEVLL